MLTTKDYSKFSIQSTTIEFDGAKKANKCLPNDLVEWDYKNDMCRLVSRAEHPLIVGTLELTNKAKYGLTSRKIPMYLFIPYDTSYPYFIVGCSEKDTSRNLIGLISFGEWAQSSTFPRGNLQTILGVSGDFEAESQAIMWQACPWKYSAKENYMPMFNDNLERERLTGYTFNIDPVGCRDVDDVFTFEKVDLDAWKVTITISDVAAYVEEGSAVDKMAEQISQTLYNTNGGVVRPMLPPQYSENACSLLTEKDSYGVSMSFIWNTSKNLIEEVKWFPSVLKVNKSYTYDEFQQSDSPYKEPLKQIASYLADRNVDDSHEWVEQMMIFYNKEAGKLLKESNVGVLRRHSAPNVERLEKFRQMDIPALEKLAYSSAEYCSTSEPENTVHYGLGTDAYAHASSPIRRYADLVNQRLLKQIITNTLSASNEILINKMNQRGKAIKRFGRDMVFLQAISTGNTRFKAIIVEHKMMDSDKKKVKLYVPEWGRMVSAWFTLSSSDNVVLSRDETREIDVTLGREVEFDCVFIPNARNWKERVVIQIL